MFEADIFNKPTTTMVTPVPLVTPREALVAFEQKLFVGLASIAAEPVFGQYLEGMADLGPELLQESAGQANSAASLLTTIKPELKRWPEARSAYWFTFVWPEKLKSFFLLWRDTLVQGNRAQVQAQAGEATPDALQALKNASLDSLRACWTELRQSLNTTAKKIEGDNGGEYFDSWNHQTNPWENYARQFQALQEQMLQIKTQQGLLTQAGLAYDNILKLSHETIGLCETQLEKVHEQSEHMISFIQENENEKPSVLMAKIEEAQQMLNFPHRLDNFLSQLESHIEGLPERINVAVDNHSGQLVTKDIAFKKISRQWIEAEILPQLYEFWEIIDRANNGLQVSLLNILNRIALLEKEDNREPTSEAAMRLSQPLEVFLENREQRKERLASLSNNIKELFAREFKVSRAFSADKYFLPNTYSLSQLRLNENEFLQGAVNLWTRFKNSIRNLRSSVEQEDALSVSEKIARAIVQRAGDPKNEQYNNIFLSKGYLGESFVVGRQQEFEHIDQLITQWRAGFRGAVLLTGPRFCGKTLFGEMIANNYFPRNIIRLQPNTYLQVEGRRFATKFDIQEPLEFIKKHTITQRPMIWLDDLDLWNDPAHPIGQNVRTLEQFISKHSSRIFFVVSCSTALKRHLEQGYKMRYAFQANIKLGKMTPHEIKEAILIRHGATHKKLVTAEGEKVSPAQFKKMTEAVIKQSEGNIGEAFFRWAMHVDRYDDEQVCFRHQRLHYLPEFLTADNGILLAAIHLEKLTNEYRLRKIFGPAFKDRYQSVLQRLLRTKVLVRRTDNWLSINDHLANELKEMLIAENFLIK